MSNAVGNECSESMREMCGRVSFSVRANAQGYAPRSSWNVQELKETAQQTYPLLYPLFSPPFSHFYYSVFISLTLSSPSPLTFSDCALSFNPLQAGLLDRNKRLMCLFMWLWTSQGKALAKEHRRTMETAWSRHRAGLMRKPPSCKKSLQEISSRASVLYREELWDYIFIPNPGWLYLTVQQMSSSCYLQCWCWQLHCCYCCNVSHFEILEGYKRISCIFQEWCSFPLIDKLQKSPRK